MKTAPFLFLALLAGAADTWAVPLDHREFDATLHAPWRGDGHRVPDARTFTLAFDYPGLHRRQDARWRLELLAPSGRRVAQWQGQVTLSGHAVEVPVRWPGQLGGHAPAPGIYRVRLHVSAGADSVDQAWEIGVGNVPAPALPAFAPMPTGRAQPAAAPAVGALPYTVYYGDLHSQTRDSDGGAPVDQCKGAQDPQSAPYGPAAAYPYAQAHGLDLLVVSEHNHMYDGSDGTNPAADPVQARALYQAGLATARDYSGAHPGFLALYGMEWGVISNGGHLNIFNSDELLGWERNASGELVADTATARGDYAGLFAVDGKPLAWTADGDAVMVLCEVLNSSAYSTSEDEGETRRSNFEQACNKLLEAGYHVAFSSNQDNHCANWGASYSNRTAVLVPDGVPLTRASFVDALRARRVFATMDKDAQLVLTANGHLMGERFENSGPLRLQAQFASLNGHRAAAVVIMEGVPGRNGDVSQLAAAADVTVTPSSGAHFYYAKVTQDDGKVAWSAPVWVRQAGDGNAGR